MFKVGAVFLGGTLWTATGKYSNYVTQFIVLGVLARLVEPDKFGVLAMVVVYTGFLNLLAEGGIANAIIRFQNLDRSQESYVFWMSFIVSSILYIVTFFLAPVVAIFFKMPLLTDLVRVVGLGIVFIGLAVVPEGVLKKRLQFKKLAVSDSLPAVFSGTIAIVLAYLDFGVWALAFNILGMLFFKATLIFILSKWRPFFELKLETVYKVFSFSSYLIAFNSINYWARNADNLIVGKYLGSLSLGYYAQAYKLMMLPNQLITSVVNAVILPLMASYEDDIEKMSSLYLKVIELLSVLTFLLGIVMIFNAETMVILIWGNEWTESAPIFRILSLMTILQPIVSTAGSVFTSTGNSKLLFKLGLFNAIVMILGMLIGLYLFDTSKGVAIGYATLYTLIVLPSTLLFVKRTLRISTILFLKSFTRPILLLFISITCIYIVENLILKTFYHDFAYSKLIASIIINLVLMLIAYKTRYKLIIQKLD